VKLGGKFDATHYSAMQIAEQIGMDGENIVLRREPAAVDDEEGGFIIPDEEEGGSPTNLDPQLLFFFEAAPLAHIARGTNIQHLIGYGDRVTTNFVVLGPPTADMQKGDTFTKGDYEYRIEMVHPDRAFMTLGEVIRITDGEGVTSA
jgi:hypothetical protein